MRLGVGLCPGSESKIRVRVRVSIGVRFRLRLHNVRHCKTITRQEGKTYHKTTARLSPVYLKTRHHKTRASPDKTIQDNIDKDKDRDKNIDKEKKNTDTEPERGNREREKERAF